jgi:DNA/RNA-binding domain of Phe-tRNA-synthetase-like protein
MIKISEEVKQIYPDIKFGTMIAGNLGELIYKEAFSNLKKNEIVKMKELYADYERNKIINSNPMLHYRNYYKKFNKTYHILPQLESIILKGRDIPDVGVFVEAMFMAEVKDLLLTAGHDMDTITTPLTISIANGGESFHGISNSNQILVKDDLYLSDQTGILSSILNGPDYRTRINDHTKEVMYFVYGVPNVTEYQITQHLIQIQNYLMIYAPNVEFSDIQIWE